MILYEYPLNERVRTYLRLEHLLVRLGALQAAESALEHHFALTTIFEIVEVAARADLKSDVLRDLDKQRQTLGHLRGNPAIAQESLEDVMAQLDQCFELLNHQGGKAGHSLSENEWLMSIRARVAIPGGTCGFDLPSYYAWQHAPVDKRRADLQRWSSTLVPLSASLALLLRLTREAGMPQKVMALNGQFQQTLPQGRSFSLMRLGLDTPTDVVPEISGNRLMLSVRFMRFNEQDQLRQICDEVAFDMSLCA